jgi:hypothetical protein
VGRFALYDSGTLAGSGSRVTFGNNTAQELIHGRVKRTRSFKHPYALQPGVAGFYAGMGDLERLLG